MYQVDICYYNEADGKREWGAFATLVWNMSFEEASEYARNYADMTLSLTESLKLTGYDGCSLDVRKMADPEPHAYLLSYDFAPGRPVEVWASDEVTSWHA
jgi:hypothetical protein